jgi:hypothetical protein
MQYFKKAGFIVARVEQRLHMPGRPFPVTRDAFGFGDLLVAHHDPKVTALVQVTATGDMNRRIRKIGGTPADASNEKQAAEAEIARHNAAIWLAAGNKIIVHGWAKRGPRGKQKRWTLTEQEITA